MELDLRYEMKYEIQHDQAMSVDACILLHPAGFTKAFPDRWINNIYFDTPSFTTCQENIDGISERKKFRLRWYGEEDKINKAKFEIKIKDNNLGSKIFIPMESDNLSEILKQIKSEKKIPDTIKPVIQNRYLRSYFINREGNFRLTVDRKISNGKIEFADSLSHSMRETSTVVVELKFDKEHLKNHKDITRFLPFRQTKHSKYVSAVLSTLSYI